MGLRFLLFVILFPLASSFFHQHPNYPTCAKQKTNPYVFRVENIHSQLETHLGSIGVLEWFDTTSHLLDRIANYRITIVEINSGVFMVPAHWDAHAVAIMLSGEGSLTILHENGQAKETHCMKAGDVIRFRGNSMYFVNMYDGQKFCVVVLAIPLNILGEYVPFYASGEDSYFNDFSDETLLAAFNLTDISVLRKMFLGENQGPFATASEKQIKMLLDSRSKSGEKSTFPYNLINQPPLESNKYGELYEVKPNQYKPLQDIDVQVCYTNVTGGGMMVPYYNSRSTKIAVVVRSKGYIEMASPQHGSHGREFANYQIHRFRAQVTRGDVYVVPAGHPIVTVASKAENLEVLDFEIGAENNQRVPLAGKNNILKQLKDQAKELSFNVGAKQVNEILNRQKESWFVSGPQQQNEQDSDASHCSSPNY